MGDVVIIGRPDPAAFALKDAHAKKPAPAVGSELDYQYEAEVDMDELRRHEESCWEGCDEV